MKKTLLVICLFIFSLSVYSFTDEEILKFISQGELEGIEQKFTTVKGGSLYIDRFNLNEQEIDMIGLWIFDSLVTYNPKYKENGPGVSVEFYPNRYFSVTKGGGDKNGDIVRGFGLWKVERGELMVRFFAKLRVVDIRNADYYQRYTAEYYWDENYYRIFTVPVYRLAFYNEEAFDWTTLPYVMRAFFDIYDIDGPRSRLLFGTFGTPPGQIHEGTRIGDIFLNPSFSQEYLIDLHLNTW